MSRSTVMSFCLFLSTEIFHRKLRTAWSLQTVEDSKKKKQKEEEEEGEEDGEKKEKFSCSGRFHSFHLSHYCCLMRACCFDLSGSVASCANPLFSSLQDMLGYCFTTSLNSSSFPAAHLTPCPLCVFMQYHARHIH